jgi:hypothetical protein
VRIRDLKLLSFSPSGTDTLYPQTVEGLIPCFDSDMVCLKTSLSDGPSEKNQEERRKKHFSDNA